MNLAKQLEQLKLSNKEIAIYLAVLKHGKISVADLARLTEIQRTTIYSAIQNLVHMGFLIEELGGAKKFYLPGSPESLRGLYKADEETWTKKKQLIEEVIRDAKKLGNVGSYNPPKIRFVQEEQIESFLYEQIPTWIESIIVTDKTWWGFQDHIFAEMFETWIDHFWKQAPEDLKLKLLSNESDVEEEMKKKGLSRRVIKYWDGENFTATVWVVGEYIVTLALKNHPFYVVQIHDPLLAENLRNLFSNLWIK
jgi:sugar-specific transcriptional regulator TrmB